MRNICRILVCALLLALVLLALGLPIFATEATDINEADAVEEIEEKEGFEVEQSYIDNDDNLILVLKDGKKYNATAEEWISEGEEGMELGFNSARFTFSLQYMWKGMLAIFIVIAVIILAVVIMSICSAKAQERKALREQESDVN